MTRRGFLVVLVLALTGCASTSRRDYLGVDRSEPPSRVLKYDHHHHQSRGGKGR